MGSALPLPSSPPRWHVDCRTDGADRAVHVVTCRLDARSLPIIVRPSARGMAAAARLADALNRAYAIEPAAGFDVSGLLGLAFHAAPAAVLLT